MGVDGRWCAPRSSKPLQVVRSCPGGFDSHILSPIKSPDIQGFLLALGLLLPKNVAPKKQDISAFLKEATNPFHFLFHFFGVKFFVRFASSLSEGAFWHCTTQKLSPRAGKVARSAERGAAQRWLRVQRAAGGVASRLLLFTPTPQSATLTAPRPGSLLGTVPPNARARYPANYRLYA